MKTHILAKIAAIQNEVIAIRRHLHQNPELSFEEYQTALFIQEKLQTWNIPFEKEIAGTGVVALINADKKELSCIGLRADMDALPIYELNQTEYQSKNPGIMHACGHDVHTSILLATAKILHEIKDEIPYQVKLIFQPGEEKLPGGAKLMIEAGVLENPKVERIYALHVFPELEVGKIGLRSGKYMASCDELHIEVIGKGGHAAMPELNIDPVKIAAELILSLQQIPEKNCPTDIPCVLAIGKVEAKGATNVIPDRVSIQGTFRTMDENWRAKAHDEIHEIASEIASRHKGKIEVNILKGYPYLENEPKLTEESRQILKDSLGADQVIDLPIRMTGEDFSFYAQKIPATFIRLGVRNESKGIIHGVHNARFDIDEKALLVGTQAFLSLCLGE